MKDQGFEALLESEGFIQAVPGTIVGVVLRHEVAEKAIRHVASGERRETAGPDVAVEEALEDDRRVAEVISILQSIVVEAQ